MTIKRTTVPGGTFVPGLTVVDVMGCASFGDGEAGGMAGAIPAARNTVASARVGRIMN
jgi:hypothetical protein